MERRVSVCWDGDMGHLGGRMNMCGDKASDDSDGEGVGVGFPPGRKSGGKSKIKGGTNKYST